MKLKTIGDIVKELDDRDLITGVLDIEKWNNGNRLAEDSVVRKVAREGQKTVCH